MGFGIISKPQKCFWINRNSKIMIYVVSICLERQWTAPEMSVRCGAALAVTVKPNSGQAVFVTVAASVRRWLRGCWSCPRSLSLPFVVPQLFPPGLCSPYPCVHHVAPVAAVSCRCFPGVRVDFGGLHVSFTDVLVAQHWVANWPGDWRQLIEEDILRQEAIFHAPNVAEPQFWSSFVINTTSVYQNCW